VWGNNCSDDDEGSKHFYDTTPRNVPEDSHLDDNDGLMIKHKNYRAYLFP
jgi:hypothetical protein